MRAYRGVRILKREPLRADKVRTMAGDERFEKEGPVLPPPRWVQDRESLAESTGEIAAGPVAIDTEADSFHHYREKVCLIQVTFGTTTLLVDPLAVTELGPLGAVLEDPAVLKVLHGADYDLRLLDRDHGVRPRNLFDTMIAARLTGERSFGLAPLLASHLDVRLDKKYQLADWSRRPLPPEMAEYAAADTRHLLDLREILADRLTELGRLEWAEEEFGRLESVRWTATARDAERSGGPRAPPASIDGDWRCFARSGGGGTRPPGGGTAPPFASWTTRRSSRSRGILPTGARRCRGSGGSRVPSRAAGARGRSSNGFERAAICPRRTVRKPAPSSAGGRIRSSDRGSGSFDVGAMRSRRISSSTLR